MTQILGFPILQGDKILLYVRMSTYLGLDCVCLSFLSFFLSFLFVKTGFLLSWNLLSRPGWTWTQRSAYFCLPSARIKGVCPDECFKTWNWRTMANKSGERQTAQGLVSGGCWTANFTTHFLRHQSHPGSGQWQGTLVCWQQLRG